MLRFLFIYLLLSEMVLASSDAGHASSVSSLLYPAINFLILVGGIIFLMKKSLSESFTTNSKEVEELANYAEKKDIDARKQLRSMEEKIDNIPTESEGIKKEAVKDGEKFAADSALETTEQIAKLDRDTQAKISYEKAAMLRELSSTLLDQVIAKAKNTIATNSDSNKKVTDKLLSKI